jgi:hypothetical protein
MALKIACLYNDAGTESMGNLLHSFRIQEQTVAPNKKRERLVTFPLSIGVNTAGRFWG